MPGAAIGPRPALGVFAAVFPAILGAGVLALPIALSPLGALGAVAVTLAIGVLNMLTIGLVALAFVRRADSLPSDSRFATVVAALLGPRVGVLVALLATLVELALMILYALGFGYTMSDMVGLPAQAWAAGALLLSLALVALQKRGVLTSAGLVATVGLLVLLTALIVTLGSRLDAGLLTAGPPLPLTASSFTLVLGVLVAVFYAHARISTIAPAALRADPSGRALIVGTVAAMGVAAAVTSIWVLVTLGSVPAADYLGTPTTGVELVRQAAGPVAGWLALAFAVLALGMSGLVSAFVAGDLVVEQVPVHRSLDVDLVAGTVIRAWDGGPEEVILRLSLAPDGSGVTARAQRGRRSATEQVADGTWDARRLLASVGGRRWGRWLRVRVTGSHVAVQSTFVLAVEHHQASAAVHVLDEGAPGRITALLLRGRRTFPDLVEALGLPEPDVTTALRSLEEQGVVELLPDGGWRAVVGRRHVATSVPAPLADRMGFDPVPRSPAWLATTRAARLVAAAPIVLALVLAVALVDQGASFTGFFSLIGLSSFVFLGVSIPLLLAISSRRNADRVVRAGPLGLPPSLLWTLWAAAVALSALYATVVYDSLAERAAAVAAAGLSVAAAVLARPAGAYRASSTLVVEVGTSGTVEARLTDAGAPGSVRMPHGLPARGRDLTAVLETVPATPLRIVLSAGHSPRPLSGPTAADGHHSLGITEGISSGSGSVDLSAASGPVSVTWRVG
jgi:DNA-binding transcriptional ArsR family regulator